MPRTRKPSDSEVMANYLLPNEQLAVLAVAIKGELARQREAGAYGLYRGSINHAGLVGAIAQAIAEYRLNTEPYQSMG